MALRVEKLETLEEVANNLLTAASTLHAVVKAMRGKQPEIALEMKKRLEWSRDLLKFANKVQGEQPIQAQLLAQGVSLADQIAARQGKKQLPKKSD